MNSDPNHQYTQGELPGNVFDAGSGAGGGIVNYNGQAVQVGNNGNGTRSLTSLGDWATYQNQQEVSKAAADQQAAFNGLLASDKQSVTDFLGQYKTDTANAVDSANTTFKIPEQTNTVNALNDRINDLKFNTNNTGQGGYSSSDQVDEAINSRYLPEFEIAVGNLNNSETAAQTQEQVTLQPDQLEGSALEQYIASSMTGFGQNEQAQLSAILGKLNAGVTLTTTEMETANNLAVAKVNYQQTIDAIKQGQNYITTPQGSTIYNPYASKIINPGVLGASGVYG